MKRFLCLLTRFLGGLVYEPLLTNSDILSHVIPLMPVTFYRKHLMNSGNLFVNMVDDTAVSSL